MFNCGLLGCKTDGFPYGRSSSGGGKPDRHSPQMLENSTTMPPNVPAEFSAIFPRADL
jgi:hypothetical protein